MANLTSKQQSFISFTTESEELARRGFELLLKRSDYDKFFDDLQNAGLFDPSHNPAPMPVEEKGYVRIPYWSVLTYLTQVAKLSGERNDLVLANKVMTVVRSIASWRDTEGKPRENYHTAHKLTEILGLVPTQAITTPDLEFIPSWLCDRFERMLVIRALDQGALSTLLASQLPQDWDKAVLILRHCTAIEWRPSGAQEKTESTPFTIADDFWLKELINHHARHFGLKAGKKACGLFLERVRELFGTESRKPYSYLYRPAAEDHFQNHAWQGAENRMVEGLRDVLAAWSEDDPDEAKSFVRTLLADDLQILRRIGIYTLDMQWANMRELYMQILAPGLFDASHLHELYNLLSRHFVEMTEKEKSSTVEAIRKVEAPTLATEPANALKRIQQQWLSAIVGTGYEPADTWFKELQRDTGILQPIEHADFNSYSEIRVGPGATPYTVAELAAFAASGTIVDKLNEFEEKDAWRGPTTAGLLSTFEEAVRTLPEPFVQSLPKFLKAKRRNQYSLLSGMKQAWDPTVGKKTQIDWEKLITFFERLLGDPEFWRPEASDDVYRDLVASAVADCLHSGTRDDDRAYSLSLLTCYVKNVDESAIELLEAVAPYVYEGRVEYMFIEELLRLADASPDGVSTILGKMIAKRIPDFDYKDQLKGLLRKLAAKGKRQDVLSYSETLRDIAGMQELFDELTHIH